METRSWVLCSVVLFLASSVHADPELFTWLCNKYCFNTCDCKVHTIDDYDAFRRFGTVSNVVYLAEGRLGTYIGKSSNAFTTRYPDQAELTHKVGTLESVTLCTIGVVPTIDEMLAFEYDREKPDSLIANSAGMRAMGNVYDRVQDIYNGIHNVLNRYKRDMNHEQIQPVDFLADNAPPLQAQHQLRNVDDAPIAMHQSPSDTTSTLGLTSAPSFSSSLAPNFAPSSTGSGVAYAAPSSMSLRRSNRLQTKANKKDQEQRQNTLSGLEYVPPSPHSSHSSFAQQATTASQLTRSLVPPFTSQATVSDAFVPRPSPTLSFGFGQAPHQASSATRSSVPWLSSSSALAQHFGQQQDSMQQQPQTTLTTTLPPPSTFSLYPQHTTTTPQQTDFITHTLAPFPPDLSAFHLAPTSTGAVMAPPARRTNTPSQVSLPFQMPTSSYTHFGQSPLSSSPVAASRRSARTGSRSGSTSSRAKSNRNRKDSMIEDE